MGIPTICYSSYSIYSGGIALEDKLYKKMYLHLFNAVTDALEISGEHPDRMKHILKAAQLDCEQIFITAEDDDTFSKSADIAKNPAE